MARSSTQEAPQEGAQAAGSAEGAETSGSQKQDAPPAQNGAKTSSYKILVSDSNDGPWAVLTDVSARSQDEAKRAAIDGKHEDEAFMAQYFIAIPANSYKPKRPTVTTKTAVSF